MAQYFSNASHFTIDNVTISNVNGNAVSIGRSVAPEHQGDMTEPGEVARENNSTGSRERHGLALLLNNISKGAFHDAAERGDPPKCHPHTRVAIRAEIMDWVDASGARDKPIIWMYGPAGSGKTAIAQSIAEMYKRAASFFFSRGAAGRNDTTRVVATIAYQISRFLPEFEDALLTTIERDPTVFSRVLATQMKLLVVEPLKALPPLPQPIFVILDGLDEAGPSAQDQANLLNAICTATAELRHIPLIFLIASRPEYEIREAFNAQLSLLTQSLVLDDTYKPDDDIRLYLTSTFAEIRDKHVRLGTRPHLPTPWPSESDVDHLVSKASGQFIFAATVLKFIDSIRHDPVERLDIIFGLSAPRNETPFALLDALYHHILSSAEEPAKVLQILRLQMLSDPNFLLQVKEIEELLDLDVRRVLVDMHALVFVPPPGVHGKLRFHHASLSDFLMDRSRSRGFYIDASLGHINLTRHWWKVMFNNHYYGRLTWFTCFENFVHHCSKLPAGVGLTDDLALFDLKQLLKQESAPRILLLLPWRIFFECIEKQAGDQEDISRRMKAEFDSFILDCLSKYPPALRTYIATILAIKSTQTSDIFRLLLCSSTKSITEYDVISNLDSTLFRLSVSPSVNNAVSALFKDEYRAGEYYVSDRRYLSLAHRIIGTILPKHGGNNRQIKFERDSDPLKYNKQVLYLEEGSLHLRLFDPDFFLLQDMLDKMPLDLDLGTLLCERALQYDGHDTTIKERYYINKSSLEYVQRCGIPYLNHVHRPGTNKCVICAECAGASVVVDLDWRNDPQADAAAFLPSLEFSPGSREVDDYPDDLDEVNGTLSPTLSSDSKASSGVEPPKKLKRKRGS